VLRRVLAMLLLSVGMAWPALTVAGQFVVGFSQDAANNEWRVAQARQLKEAFDEMSDVKFEIVQASGSTAQQIIDIDNFVQRRVNLLIVSPRDATLLAAPVARAYRAGIPVMLITRRVDGEDFTTHVGPDDEAIGRAAARLIAQRLGGRGKVLMLKGTPTTSTAIARTQGFVDELSRLPGMQLVDTRTANYQRSEAIREMESVLSKGLAFDAIYAQNDTMASGARLALKQAGRDLRKIVLVGIDYLPEAREAILAGEQTASFIYPTCVPEIVSTARAILAGSKVPRRVPVRSTLVERSNADSIKSAF
jgi:ribose transport system substrate-binding protein